MDWGIFFFWVFLPNFCIHKRKLLKILRILQYFGELLEPIFVKIWRFSKKKSSKSNDFGLGHFYFTKKSFVWNLALKKNAKKKRKRKRENTGSNWIQYLCGQRVGKFHSRSVISKCFCIFFVGIAYQGKNDIVFRLFIIESIVASWIFLVPPGNNNRSIFIWGFLKDDNFGSCWNLRLVIKL